MKAFAVVVAQGMLSATMKFEAEDLEALVAEFEEYLRTPTIIRRKGEAHPDTAIVMITSPLTTFEIKGSWDSYMEAQAAMKAAQAARQVVPASALVRAGALPVGPQRR